MNKFQIAALVLIAAFSITAAKAADSLDKILSVEMAAEVAGFPAADAQKEYKPDAKYKETEVLSYSWNNGRKRMAGAIEIPAMDTVKFGWVRKSSLATLKGQAADPSYKDFMETVDEVGDFAIWNSRDKQLIVLSGEKSFSIWVSVSADEAVNKAKCLELGKKIAGKF
jgi:hypothetical protein